MRPFGEETLTDISRLVIDILLPLYLFFNTAGSATLEAISEAPILVIAGLLIPFLSCLIAYLFHRQLNISDQQQPVIGFSLMLANTAFLGFPICEALLGSTGVFYAVLYDFGLTIIGFTLGIWLLSGGRLDEWKKLLLNPLILSVIAGLVWALTGISFPDWLVMPFSTLGEATLPIALLIAGAQVGNIRFIKGSWKPVFSWVIALRLVIIPLVFIGLFYLIGWNDTTSKIIILQAAMPVAVSSTIFAKRYGADANFTATVTLWSTLGAIISLPLIALLII
jgi:predicted permease